MNCTDSLDPFVPALNEQGLAQWLQHPALQALCPDAALHPAQGAPHNIFTALGVARSELHHSRWLAYLLQPTEAHGQGVAFVRAWVQHLVDAGALPPAALAPQPLQQALVTTEQDTAGLGRIDVLLQLGDGSCIGIENKVDAGEQEAQLARYAQWLRAVCPPGAQAALVFLTPDGRASQTLGGADTALQVPVVCLSYAQLAGILEGALAHCAPEAQGLRTQVQEYAQLCRRLTQEMDPMYNNPIEPDVAALLREPAQLRTVLAMASRLEQVKHHAKCTVRTQFKAHMVAALQAKLQQHPDWAAQWQAGYSVEYAGQQLVGIVPRTHTAHDRGYCCVLEVLDSRLQYIGWRRPCAEPQAARWGLPEAIEAHGLGGSNHDWVVWARVVQRTPALAPVQYTDDDAVLRLLDDERDPAHPLASNAAEVLWRYFVAVLPHITQLQLQAQDAGAAATSA